MDDTTQTQVPQTGNEPSDASPSSTEAQSVAVTDAADASLPTSTGVSDVSDAPPASSSDVPNVASIPPDGAATGASTLEGDDLPNGGASDAASLCASGTSSSAPNASLVDDTAAHPAHSFADRIHSLAVTLEGSADSMLARMGVEIRRLVADLKSVL